MADAETLRAAGALIAGSTYCALGTVDERGVPSVTYVPFVATGGALGIAVSRLASHTASLAAQRPTSVMLVDDVHAGGDAYARPRFTIAVVPSAQAPGSARAEAIWSALERRHGDTVQTLRMLPDFVAFALEPHHGRLVLGFAAAHDVAGAEIVALLR